MKDFIKRLNIDDVNEKTETNSDKRDNASDDSNQYVERSFMRINSKDSLLTDKNEKKKLKVYDNRRPQR